MNLQRAFVIQILAMMMVLFAGPADALAQPMPLKDVRTWLMQTQKLESERAIRALAATPYDMIVIDSMSTVKPSAKVDMRPVVKKLREAKKNRIVLCYLDVAEAEAYRTYWQKSWKTPGKNSHGKPDFILMDDPQGWADNYPVAFWDKRWQDILLDPDHGVVKRLMDEGYDGVYLDWVQGWDDAEVAAEASRQHVDSAAAMVDLIGRVRDAARNSNPNAVVIAQNGAYLIDAEPRLADVIDGISFEHTWFGGKADVDWNDPRGGDRSNDAQGAFSTERLLRQYEKYQKAGKAVFIIDYCLKAENAAKVYENARQHRLVPLVTQISVEHLTGTPPPELTGKR